MRYCHSLPNHWRTESQHRNYKWKRPLRLHWLTGAPVNNLRCVLLSLDFSFRRRSFHKVYWEAYTVCCLAEIRHFPDALPTLPCGRFHAIRSFASFLPSYALISSSSGKVLGEVF